MAWLGGYAYSRPRGIRSGMCALYLERWCQFACVDAKVAGEDGKLLDLRGVHRTAVAVFIRVCVNARTHHCPGKLC